MPQALDDTALLAATQTVLSAQLQEIDRQIEQLRAQREALQHFATSELFSNLVVKVREALEKVRPDIDAALLEVFRSDGPRLRTSDAVRALVKERGLPVTSEDVQATLNRMGTYFEPRGRGWWSLAEPTQEARR